LATLFLRLVDELARRYGRRMTKQTIATTHAPGSPLYSQGIRVGPTIHVSGMVGVDPATTELAGPSIQEQTRQAIRNCEAILATAGATLDDVALVTVLLTDPADFAGMNEAYAEAFAADPPARAVAKLGVDLPGVLVSIMMTAYTEN
jgi:2-iminobutanoate/2-iminopropanoate deaminase